MEKNKKYNLISLQILRALAASSVVYLHIVHPFNSQVFPVFGKFGVDIFFVLSGFVMAMVIARGQSPLDFAISRISRIIPLYWLLSIFLFIVALIQPDLLASTTANVKNFIFSLFFVPHFRDFGTMHPILAVGWTLNYEMFFYLCIWISIIFVRRFYLLASISIILIVYTVGGQLLDNKVLNHFFGNLYLFEFVLGLFSFYINKHKVFDKLHISLLIGLVIICFCGMAAFEVSHMTSNRVVYYGLPSSIMLLSMTSIERSLESTGSTISSFLTKAGITKLLVQIGDSSYATYLTHLYIVEGVRRVLLKNAPYFENSFALLFIIMGLAIFVGYVVYIMLDKPMSKNARKYLRNILKGES